MLIRMILTLGEASATCGGRSEGDVVIGELRIHIAGVLLIPQLWFEGWSHSLPPQVIPVHDSKEGLLHHLLRVRQAAQSPVRILDEQLGDDLPGFPGDVSGISRLLLEDQPEHHLPLLGVEWQVTCEQLIHDSLCDSCDSLPVSSSYMTTPSPHQSTARPYSLLDITSGGR